ncbi:MULTISPECIES: hypothetical protein [Pseudomonadota]|uniref:hypothetical protein n=1 Tax=Pseudomonadota TaxID=1224 RepID=UPI00200EAA56|nr:hypothetical protein [Halomonas venusta]UQI42754.1 hypothetical protein M3L73_11010 [Halomonas venusta]
MARGWSKPLSGFIDQSRDMMMVTMSAASEEAARGIIYRSPKDTSRFLANNNFSINEPDESYDPEKRDVRREDALANARRAIASLRPGDVFHAVNTTPYGEVLESGSSTQAPHGIYGLTANDLKEKYG